MTFVNHLTTETASSTALHEPLAQRFDWQGILADVCQDAGLTVDHAPLLASVQTNMYDNLSVSEHWQTMIMAARTLIEVDPGYSYVAARILLLSLYQEALG